ncbi:GTP cyclohydrolase II [Leuconostoc fallax]|nr:GTP cyclohydrolase II [Leuconostoc fallax]MCO6183655.1 GTP cyclohydrolase II [Leuconostoc fallax]
MMTTEESIEKVKIAVNALKQGELIILTDDQDREHEGDLVGLASFVTPEAINRALSIARGVLAVPMTRARAEQLALAQMTSHNSEKFGTKFTVSVDHMSSTTGVSAYERAHTIKQLANLSTTAADFETPGHIFPLVAEDGGVLKRQGHTEGAVELAKIAGVPPIAYIIEILAQDGTMAREQALSDLAQAQHLIQLSIQDLMIYRQVASQYTVKQGTTVHLPSTYGDFNLTEYRGNDGEPHLLMQSRQLSTGIPLVRVHSECLTGEIFGSLRCECGPQLHKALEIINQEGGAVVYLRQEGRGIGLHEKLKTYVLQENQYDTYDANVALGHQPDARDYRQAAEILKAAGMTQIRLLTNNPQKMKALIAYGIEVVECVPLITGINTTNQQYMATKKNKFKHML